MFTHQLKRSLAFLLAVVLIFSMAPMQAFAAESENPDYQIESNTETMAVEPETQEETPEPEQDQTAEEAPEAAPIGDCSQGHTVAESDEEPSLCDAPGMTAGTYCSVCGITLSGRDEIPARGHVISSFDAKKPTFSSVGWEAYERCLFCGYTTYVEIPAVEVPTITDFETFLFMLSLLEELADMYVMENPGKDPLDLMIKYIRTGVDRYNSGSWGIMAGYEDAGFAKFVSQMEDMINAEMDEESMIAICSLKKLGIMTLPNGDKVDIGHMFGTMDITYHNKFSQNHADVAGWSGDLVDLLEFADICGVSGSLEEMVQEIGKDYLLKNPPADIAAPSFSQADMRGDLDALYVMDTLKKQGYEKGALVALLSTYLNENLTDEARAEYYLKNRLDGVSTRAAVREAVYNAYISNKVISTLEGTREFQSNDLDTLRQAVCYAFADYICKLAGDYVEAPETSYYDVFMSSYDVLAPGITQEIKRATTVDGKQIVYYVATADITRPDVDVFANYNDADPSKGWAMQRVLDQANAAQKRYGDPESPEYIPNYNVIVGTNGAGYDMTTGEPGGLLVMGGKEYHGINSNGFFGILNDGTAVIGTTQEYNTIYKGQVRDGIAGFGKTLIKDGKIVASGNTDRASRTAVGITKTGKVVLMVLDGRQLPWSCGGDYGEIAQIMLEAGCYHAINLDGGGSTTFVAKQPGAEALDVVNRPSDGFQRSVSTSLIMVSTAPSSTAFDHAILESDTDYMTIGASIQLTPKGISATGNEAELPEDLSWSVSNSRWATVTEDGLVTGRRAGEVEVYLMSGDTVIGSKTIHIVYPDRVYFTRTNIDTVFGATVALPVQVLYEGKMVAVNASDLVFSLSNTRAGTMDGFNFVCTDNENSNIKNVVITAALASDPSITGSITIALYKQGEASFDFDQATGGDRMLAWFRQVSNAVQEDANTYIVADPSEQMVTNYTLAIDMTRIPIPAQLEELTYMLPGSDVEGASAWTFLLQLAQRISPLSEITAKVQFDPAFDVDISDMKLVNEFFTLTDTIYDAETNSITVVLNWKKQTAALNPDTANPLCIVSGIKLTPKADANWGNRNRLNVVNTGAISYRIYMRASALYSFAQKPENQKTFGLYAYANPNDAADKGGYFQDTYKSFEDQFTLINATKEGWIVEDGGYTYYVDGARLTGIQMVDGLYYNFGQNGINAGKAPYSGLFQIDGINHYAKNGEIYKGWYTIDDTWYFFDWHTGKGVDGAYNATIEGVDVTYLLDNGRLAKGYWHETEKGLQYFYGPYLYKQGLKEIDGEQYIFDEYYACTGIRPVRLAHSTTDLWYEFTDRGVMVGLAPDGLHWFEGNLYYVIGGNSDHYGFYNIGGDYYYFQASGKAFVGRSSWASKTNNLLPEGTYRFGADGKVMMAPAVVDENGTLYYYNDGRRTASAGLVLVDGDYYYIGSGAIAYKDTTVWVEKTNGLKPRGSYIFGADGKMVLLDGIVNGYYYENGEKVSAGLIRIGDDYYYAGGGGKIIAGKRAWLDKTNGLMAVGTYRFDAEGKMIMTTEIVFEDGAYYYYNAGKRTASAGLVLFDGNYYYIDGAARAVCSKKQWVEKTNNLKPKGIYTFDAEGKMEIYNGIVEGYYYVDGVKTSAGLVNIGNDYYYAAGGGKVIVDKPAWVSNTNGLVEVGTYRFDAEGKMIRTTELVNENGTLYYYRDGKRTGNVGLLQIDGEYYYIGSGAIAVADRIVWVEKTNGLKPVGTYTFGADGKMVRFNGVVDGYYYVDGVKTYAGLVQANGAYYYAAGGGKLVAGKRAWVEKTNGLLAVGTYRFDAEGKMIMNTEVFFEDGAYYYYYNGKRTASAGLVLLDGSYYYIDGAAKAVCNVTQWVEKTNGLKPKGTYTFDAEGKMEIYNGIVDGYYYVDGVKTAVGLIEIGGDYYYAAGYGKIIAGKPAWVSNTNGLVEVGTYRFDADGKMIRTTELVNEDGTLYYYRNGKRTGNVGLIEIDGDYYYVGNGAIAAANTTVWVEKTNGLMAKGTYEFDAEGKMIR
jgi:glucan-binding YG repeat protein